MALVIDALCRAVAARAGRHRALAPIVLVVWSYLRRLSARFDALVARSRAGKLGAASRCNHGPNLHAQAPRTRSAPRLRLPRGHGWLIRLVPEAAVFGSQLQYLLSDPDMVALLAAGPQAGRLLRPLCRALGLRPGPDVPPTLFPPRRVPATLDPVSPGPEPPTPRSPNPGSPDPGSPDPEPLMQPELAGFVDRDMDEAVVLPVAAAPA